jgi:hypothetical protein
MAKFHFAVLCLAMSRIVPGERDGKFLLNLNFVHGRLGPHDQLPSVDHPFDAHSQQSYPSVCCPLPGELSMSSRVILRAWC